MINRMSNRNFVMLITAVVLAALLGGGYLGIKAMQNSNRASACEASGGTAYGRDNWLCVK